MIKMTFCRSNLCPKLKIAPEEDEDGNKKIDETKKGKKDNTIHKPGDTFWNEEGIFVKQRCCNTCHVFFFLLEFEDTNILKSFRRRKNIFCRLFLRSTIELIQNVDVVLKQELRDAYSSAGLEPRDAKNKPQCRNVGCRLEGDANVIKDAGDVRITAGSFFF